MSTNPCDLSVKYEENEHFPQVFPKLHFKKYTEYSTNYGLIGYVGWKLVFWIHAFLPYHRKSFISSEQKLCARLAQITLTVEL